MRDIGKNIRDIRKAKGMTQDALAAALFVTRQTVSNYENGKSRPDMDMLLQISDILETDMNAIFYGPPIPQCKKDGYRWLKISGSVVLVVTVLYWALCLLFPKESYWGWEHALRLVNQLVMFPTVMFSLGWFVVHCLSVTAGLQQLKAGKMPLVRGMVLVVLILLALIPVPMIVFYLVVAYRSYVYHFVSMSFPYIPVYRECFQAIIFVIDKMPVVYALLGGVAWLLGWPIVRKQPQIQ